MKVHYERTIKDQIDDVIIDAAKNWRKIDYIELTPEEKIELEVRCHRSEWEVRELGDYYRGIKIVNVI